MLNSLFFVQFKFQKFLLCDSSDVMLPVRVTYVMTFAFFAVQTVNVLK